MERLVCASCHEGGFIARPAAMKPATLARSDIPTIDSTIARRLMLAIVVVGMCLRVGQYIANPAMWTDELLLSENIIRLPLLSLLTTSLDNGQVAPGGFLLIEKLAVLTLGPHAPALRLMPLLCALLALVLFRRVSTRMLTGWGPAISVALFAFAAPLIAFGSQVKQYSADVFVAVLMLWVAIEVESEEVTVARAGWACVIGAAVVWLSQAAVFVLLGLCVALALHAIRGYQAKTISNPRLIILVMFVWAASTVAATTAGLALMSPDRYEFMRTFWADGLLPYSLTDAIKGLWPLRQLQTLLGVGGPASLGYRSPWIFIILCAGGLGLLWRRHDYGLMLAAPIGVTLLAAAARRYPFSDRLILFLVPSLLVALAASLEWVRQTASSVSSKAGGAVALLVLAVPVLYPSLTRQPIYQTENVAPVLAYVRDHWQAADSAYVYYGADLAMTFYGPTFNLDNSFMTRGGCHRGENRAYLSEIDAFRGRTRLWIIVTHALPMFAEEEDIVAYLDEIGVRRAALRVPPNFVGNWGLPASVYLYSLDDVTRLRRATAGSFRLRGLTSATAAYGC
jgi:hypothetical protein